jgi:cellulose synthase/poly-beta-1,6-N-acetylglucosamine synthase-like glycosyltransferase
VKVSGAGNVDIVTVVWRETPDELDRFGEALGRAWQALPPERRGESVLVENGGDSQTAQHAASVLSGALGVTPRVIRLERNRGPTHAYNRGFDETSGAYVCLFDPDGAPDPDALPRLVTTLDDHPRAALAAADVLPFDGSPQSGGDPVEVEWASAGATVYRLDALREVNGFDELFAYTCEEMDLGYRCRKAGWTCLRVPTAGFRHEVEHKTSWRRAFLYLEYLMAWRHVHFSRAVTAKSWLMQLPYLVSVGRTSGWRVAGGGLLGLFAYLRLVPACERRR